MQMKNPQGAPAATPAFATFYPDGVAETFTNAGTISITKVYDLPGGMEFNFLNDGTADSTECYVDGDHIEIGITAGN
jgi:hypothetical protein